MRLYSSGSFINFWKLGSLLVVLLEIIYIVWHTSTTKMNRIVVGWYSNLGEKPVTTERGEAIIEISPNLSRSH